MSACLPCMRPLFTGLLKLIGYESSQSRPTTNVVSLNTWRSSQTRINFENEVGMWKESVPRSNVVSIHLAEPEKVFIERISEV